MGVKRFKREEGYGEIFSYFISSPLFPHFLTRLFPLYPIPLYVTLDPSVLLSCGTLNRRYVAETNCASPERHIMYFIKQTKVKYELLFGCTNKL